MQVFLHLLDGTVQLVDPQELTQYQNGHRLIYQGQHLTHPQDLSPLANVYLTADLDGGKKKKKKKQHTTKKKNKHIHKKIKGLIFSLYSVDKQGKVTQQKKTCPSCGPGTFMAQHWDRYYCGLCHTTIKMDAETIKKNEETLRIRKEKLEAERKAKAKEDAEKAPAAKGKKDAKKGGKKK